MLFTKLSQHLTEELSLLGLDPQSSWPTPPEAVELLRAACSVHCCSLCNNTDGCWLQRSSEHQIPWCPSENFTWSSSSVSWRAQQLVYQSSSVSLRCYRGFHERNKNTAQVRSCPSCLSFTDHKVFVVSSPGGATWPSAWWRILTLSAAHQQGGEQSSVSACSQVHWGVADCERTRRLAHVQFRTRTFRNIGSF